MFLCFYVSMFLRNNNNIIMARSKYEALINLQIINKKLEARIKELEANLDNKSIGLGSAFYKILAQNN